MNPLARLRRRLAAEAAADPRGGLVQRVGIALSGIFLVASLLAIGRIGWALGHGTVWVNYRGSVLSHGDMYLALGLSALVALGSIGMLGLLWRTPGPDRR